MPRSTSPSFLLTILCLMLLPGLTVLGGEAKPPAGATKGTDEFADFADEFATGKNGSGAKKPLDPLSGYNRFMFAVNDRLYFWVLKPVASGYAKITPEGCRAAVNRFFKNLAFPQHFVNNVLQGEWKDAGVECARFGINISVGLLGLFDPAQSRWQLSPREEDFGQTLGRYRVGDGFPLVLPLLGPSNLRDTVGLIPDGFLNPVNYVQPIAASIGIHAGEKLNYTSLHLGEYESMKKAALDPYIFLKDAYKQNRDKRIEE